MSDMQIKVPEDFGSKIQIGSFAMKDIAIFVVVLLVFIAFALIIPSLFLQVLIIIVGFVVALIFAFRKVDGLDFYAYLGLKLTRRSMIPNLGVATLKLYGDDMLFNGSEYFKIISITNGIALDFMSDEAKFQKFGVYEQLLNACDFPLQIIIKTRKVKENVFDSLVKEQSALAEGYKELIHRLTKDLYLQFYYIVVPVRTWELQGATTEIAQVRKAKEMLDIRTNVVLDYLNSLELNARIVKGKSQIYDAVKGGLR